MLERVGRLQAGTCSAEQARKSSTRDASQQWVYQPADNGGHRAAQPDRFDLHVNAAIFLFEPPTGSGGWRLMQRKVRRITDDTAYRIRRLYMAGAAHRFRTGRLNVYQTLLVKPLHGETGLPLTREDWYRA